MSRWVRAVGVVGVLAWSTSGWTKDIPDNIQTMLSDGQWSHVVAPLTEFLKKDKKNVEAWAYLGRAWYELERYEDALPPYEEAYDLKRKYWPGTHGYVRVLTELNRFEEADKVVRKAIDDSKKEDQVQAMFYHDLGLLQLAEGRQDTSHIDMTLLDSAETNFYVAGVQAPDSCQFRISRGEIQFAIKRYPMAIAAYEEVLACNPDMAGEVNYRIARAYLYQREFPQAIKHYALSAEAHPDARVYSQLGDAWVLYSRTLETGDTTGLTGAYASAIEAYNHAKELAADDCRVFEKVGKAQALMGMLDQAALDFEHAITCGSEDPDVYFALGNVLIDLMRFDDAARWYENYRNLREASLAENPWQKPDADFFANYGYVYRRQAESIETGPAQDSLYDLAIEYYEQAWALDDSRADILDDLGIAYYLRKHYDRAISIFNQKIQMEPELCNTYLNRAYCYLQQKEWNAVLQDLELLLDCDTCNSQALEIGGYVAAFEMKKGPLAREWYRRTLKCEPTNCDAKMYIGYTYLETNDTAQIRTCIPALKESYECRLANGENRCSENIVQNALWLAEAYFALRNLDQTVLWADKVLACDPNNERAGQLKKQAESEY